MSLKAFFKSKIFLKQLLIAIGITFGLFFITLFFLRIYTNHGGSITVPDMSGRSQKQALEALEDIDLKPKVIDSMYVRGAIPGSVVDQFPKAGAKVKANRAVYLTLCTASQEQVTMPQLKDISYRQAVNTLEIVGLTLGKVIYKPSEYADLVLDQQVGGQAVPAGSKINKGARIDLVVGQVFSGDAISVPNLVGQTFSEAKIQLSTQSLAPGSVICDESIISAADSASAIVWKQRPGAGGEQVFQGQSVDLWLTTDSLKIQRLSSDDNNGN